MSRYQRENYSAKMGQEKTRGDLNKHIMFFLTTTLIMLSGALILIAI